MIRNTAKRMRFTPLALTTVLLSAGLLSLSVTGTLAGFSAAITNSTNTVATGTLIMQETGSTNGTSATCVSNDSATAISGNASTCSTINKFGGTNFNAMVPGSTVNQTVTFKNAGTVNAGTFTLTPGATCTQTKVSSLGGSATDLCAKLTLVVKQDGTEVYNGLMSAFAGSAAKTLSVTNATAGATSSFAFQVTLDAGAGNGYQGLQASMPMTWTYSS
jgi:hypothetical protein